MIFGSGAFRLIVFAVFTLCVRSGFAEPANREKPQEEFFTPLPRIALIIDDLGYKLPAGRRVAKLPGPVACAILPHTPFGAEIARKADAAGKEVLLHLPLQSVEEFSESDSGTIKINDNRRQLVRIFKADLASVPHVVGVNNHMGSLLTQHPGHMMWLMDAVKASGGLFFVDSYTTQSSIALQMARENGVPSVRRDVFLDNVLTEAAIAREFERLKGIARSRGMAIGIGHPHSQTLRFLERVLPELSEEGIQLVAVRSLTEAAAPAIHAVAGIIPLKGDLADSRKHE